MKQLFGVIGNPIAHSMSPDMQNDAFANQGIDAYYHAFKVCTEDLKHAVMGMKAIGVQGFNVTVPHKTNIIPLLDRIDPLAKAIGAVNTVKYEDGDYVGYNTDGPGYVKGLLSILSNPLSSYKALLIGAGGAARGLYFSLIQAGLVNVDLANRTVTKAKILIEENPYRTKVQSKALSLEEAEDKLDEYHLIINTTSIGMSPKVEESPLSLKILIPNTIVSDIIYNPLETRFLREAKEKGAFIQNGLLMFVHQGALAFHIWTGIEPDLERMQNIVLNKLGG